MHAHRGRKREQEKERERASRERERERERQRQRLRFGASDDHRDDCNDKSKGTKDDSEEEIPEHKGHRRVVVGLG